MRSVSDFWSCLSSSVPSRRSSFLLRAVQRISSVVAPGAPASRGPTRFASARTPVSRSPSSPECVLHSNRAEAAPRRRCVPPFPGAVLAIAVLVATAHLWRPASVDSSPPSRYGWNWNYVLLSGFAGAEDLPAHQTAVFLGARTATSRRGRGSTSPAPTLDGQARASPCWPRTARCARRVRQYCLATGVQQADQIVLGSTTMAQLHKRVRARPSPSTTPRRSPFSCSSSGPRHLPAIEDGVGMGSGAIVSSSNFPTSLLNLQDNSIPGPNAILVRTRSDVTAPSVAYRSLEKVNNEINAIPTADSPAGGVVTVLRPVEIVNFHSMGATPTIFAGSLALGAITALGITLGASVRRRRRELALLKALGFTQRQLRAPAIAWQAILRLSSRYGRRTTAGHRGRSRAVDTVCPQY